MYVYYIFQGLSSIGNMIGVSVNVPDNYAAQFTEVDLTFVHQSVFDPAARKEVCLEPLPKEPSLSVPHFRMYPLLHTI